MKDYNGFPAEFRTKVYNQQKTQGLMIPISKMSCSICGGSGGFMMGHTENYYDLTDLRPVCVECHMKLHARFSRPGVWIMHLMALIEGYKPTQWKTTGEYFANQGKTRLGGHTLSDEFNWESAKEDPAGLGSEWYHQLKMTKIDLYTGVPRTVTTAITNVKIR